MPTDSAANEADAMVTVLGWAIPRPTGRWHQSVVVTNRSVFITPELALAENQKLVTAAAEGVPALRDFLRNSGWVKRPQRCALADVRGVHWSETTGWLRISTEAEDVIGAMIPDRNVGGATMMGLKQAIAQVRAHANGSVDAQP